MYTDASEIYTALTRRQEPRRAQAARAENDLSECSMRLPRQKKGENHDVSFIFDQIWRDWDKRKEPVYV